MTAKQTSPISTVFTPEIPSEIKLVLPLNGKVQNPQQNITVATLHKDSCSKNQTEISSLLTLKIPFSSPFGDHLAFVKIDPKFPESQIEIDDKFYKVSLTNSAEIVALGRKICDEEKLAEYDITMQISIITSLLRDIAPACNIAYNSNDKAVRCNISTEDPLNIAKELNSLQNKIFLHWQRQPYFISRKIAIARNFSRAFLDDNIEDEIDNFCHIINLSFRGELPLIVTNKDFAKKLCAPDSQNRKELAAILLTETTRELKNLVLRHEKESFSGTISIRLLKKNHPITDFLVNLQPLNSDQKSTSNIQDTIRIGNEDKQLFACWNPLYSTNIETLVTAEALEIFNQEKTGTHCSFSGTINKSALESTATRYLLENLASEREFTVLNGHKVKLTLLEGDYRYFVTPYPASLSQRSSQYGDKTVIATGIINWKGKHPSPSITESTVE